MLFLVPDGDGRIIQANKVYDAPKQDYIDQMEAMEHGYVAIEAPGLISPEKYWCPGPKNLAERSLMTVAVSKNTIKAGGVDVVVITGAPAECDFRVEVNIPGVGAVTTHAGKLPEGELEIGMDMPCLFTIYLIKFPFRDFSVVIEARA
jgi:hypothetical protein